VLCQFPLQYQMLLMCLWSYKNAYLQKVHLCFDHTRRKIDLVSKMSVPTHANFGGT
jgi:hypothetical protein